MRGSMLGEFARLARTFALEPTELMSEVGIDDNCLNDPDLIVSVSAMYDLLELAARKSSVYDFGLRLAEARGLPDFGAVNMMIREQETVRDALVTMIDFFHLHAEAACITLDERDYPILSMTMAGHDGKSHRQGADMAVAQLTSILRWLVGEGWNPELACFAHDQPPSTLRYRQFFRCPVDFRQDFNGIVLSPLDLNRKLISSSPFLRREAEKYVRTLSTAKRRSYPHKVERIVASVLPRGECCAEDVSHYLGTTPRTLNRRLAIYGVNFSTILDTVRRDLAVEFLLDTNRPISDVVGLVGFNSVSAFSTWFRKSFSCTPREWRKSHGWARY